MRRRITIAILGTVTAALLLTGLGTLGLDRISSRSQTERDLRAQAGGLADLMVPAASRGNLLLRPALSSVLKGFKLEGIGFMYINPARRTHRHTPRRGRPRPRRHPATRSGQHHQRPPRQPRVRHRPVRHRRPASRSSRS